MKDRRASQPAGRCSLVPAGMAGRVPGNQGRCSEKESETGGGVCTMARVGVGGGTTIRMSFHQTWVTFWGRL